ncbi:hypothetical protein [Halorientalis halophila]|uniref:hypothetical protein n=1 Tax=Halorientalis halophila TaxID=3108499 RepID=UPI0030093AD0
MSTSIEGAQARLAGASLLALGSLGIAAVGGYRLVRGVDGLLLAVPVVFGILGGVLGLGGTRLLYAEAMGERTLESTASVAGGTVLLLGGSGVAIFAAQITAPLLAAGVAVAGLLLALLGLTQISAGAPPGPA